ncbi:mandelate racemase [Microlunatus elymi]|uniref:Mandelate racemase n=1 Tax=Microlunatus elymi TaxID=2596828 RepID=A0A516Q2B7_9ACTN|nr:enolase C-terminal domain-like protein [Microlunatus elymi]QDP97522.1 mandelate racemase [Microlunatus elymi]
MTSDPTITGVRSAELPTHYPRTVGRNARLGSHGDGGTSAIAIIDTDSGQSGWGLIEQAVSATMIDDVVGRPLSELIDPNHGVRADRHCWLDAPLHDLLGVVLDLPVYAILGGRGSTAVEVYDGAIYFDDLDPESAPRGTEAVLANCRADRKLGYRDFKIKIGRGNRWRDRDAGDRRDVEITRLVRDAYPDTRILVDANDGYDLTGFQRYLDAVADVGLYWVEEPFADDADDLAQLRDHLNEISPQTLIAEGETDPDLDELLPIAAAGHIDVLLMDVMSFGISRWRRTMAELIKHGVVGSPHAWGRPLKTVYAAHLAAGLGNIPVVEGVPGSTERVDLGSHVFADGILTLSDRPGFGLSLLAG